MTAIALACVLVGCASLPAGSTRDPRDHVERLNRAMFRLNATLDHVLMRPIARGYVKVAPRSVRTGVSNFLANLDYTRTIVNDALQGRARDFGSDLLRLIVNTTVGMGGFFDPATRLGLHEHDRDFGQTLGVWGVPAGSYLVLPLFGPSDVRDACGLVPDRFTTIDGYLSGFSLNVSVFASRDTDARAQALASDSTLANAYDPYALVRSAWFQQREYKVHENDPNYLPALPPLDLSSR